MRMETPLHYEILPAALNVLLPNDVAGERSAPP
jgi:hypothetical protein